MSWPVITRQRALREKHPTVKVGDTCWYVPQVGPHEYGPVAVPVRLLGKGRQIRTRAGRDRAVSVELLADAPPEDDEPRPAGLVVAVPDREVGPDALRDHAAQRAAEPEQRDAYGMPPLPPKWALDLFCPVHGYIHGYIDDTPVRRCDGEPQLAPPLPGDAVRLASPWDWGHLWVKEEDIGVLDGLVGRPLPPHGASITFNASTFHDDAVVSCSGGPATIATPPSELARTTNTVTITAWEWRDGFARRDNAAYYPVTVPVWDWHPTD